MAGGRPSKYDPEVTPVLAKYWARDGLTEAEMATRFGVCRDTLHEWKRKYSEFSDALKESKEIADRQVEDSLYRRAVGFEYEEIKVIATKDGKTAKVEKTKKFIAPDVTAQIFWLKNRQPERWRDVQRQEHTGANGGPIKTETTAKEDLSHYTTEELLQMQVIHETANARRNKQGTG